MFKNLYLTRKQEKLLAVVICAVLMVSTGAGMGIYYETFRVPAIIQAQQVKQTMEEADAASKEVEVVTVKESIRQGAELTAASLQHVKLPKDKLPQSVIRETFTAEGKVAKVDIPAGMLLVPEMLVDYDKVVTADLRRQDYSYMRLITGLQKSTPEIKQYVDVRIKRPDGSDDVVLSKKEVVDLAGNTIFFNINEMERTLCNSAAVEAQLKNCDIYTTLYIDPDNQPPAVVTYITNPEIAKLIEKNPNIINQSIQQLEQQSSQPIQNTVNGSNQQDDKNQPATNNESWQNLNN